MISEKITIFDKNLVDIYNYIFFTCFNLVRAEPDYKEYTSDTTDSTAINIILVRRNL